MEPNFAIGDLVRHRRFNYRGVIIEAHRDGAPIDLDWPDLGAAVAAQEQPWYRVLVHGGRHATSVGEPDLEVDEGGEQVLNPRLKDFFASFSKGRYQPRLI